LEDGVAAHDALLVAVTEKRTVEEIDRLVKAFEEASS
jgi:glycine cleavage system pyridoxal-binding protein P